ncbi:unnamed protein product [Pieris brassicae]|uniref:Uncharacterized protein n=1 Tax=Pieris brassicae TaxID=7116 RepID=A0A9P0TMP1_PIEBR|nr:unnamed protein product [Pieris brassicae]
MRMSEVKSGQVSSASIHQDAKSATSQSEHVASTSVIKVLVDAWRENSTMSGMTGASMLRTRRKDVNVKPNRKLDRKSSRGMLYENEELRLRTININAEIERGQSDIKKLKRENEQLKREISALRYEYDRLDRMLRERRSSPEHSDRVDVRRVRRMQRPACRLPRPHCCTRGRRTGEQGDTSYNLLKSNTLNEA